MTYDWDEFTVHTYINRPLDDCFKAWVTPAGLESFFLESALFKNSDGKLREADEPGQAGDKYHWTWIHKHELEGSIIKVVDLKSVTFTFAGMEVEVSFYQTDDKTLIKLRQYNIPHETEKNKATGHLNCRSCWVFYMTNQKSVMENGYDLREPESNRSDAQAVFFVPPEL